METAFLDSNPLLRLLLRPVLLVLPVLPVLPVLLVYLAFPAFPLMDASGGIPMVAFPEIPRILMTVDQSIAFQLPYCTLWRPRPLRPSVGGQRSMNPTPSPPTPARVLGFRPVGQFLLYQSAGYVSAHLA